MDTSFNNHFTMAMDLSRGQHTSSSGALGGSTGSSRSSSQNELSMTSSQSESSQSPLSSSLVVDPIDLTRPRRRKGSKIPDKMKDNVYWEKRKKNNEAARRSRNARKIKEMETARKVEHYTKEVIKLEAENAAIKNSIARLTGRYYKD